MPSAQTTRLQLLAVKVPQLSVKALTFSKAFSDSSKKLPAIYNAHCIIKLLFVRLKWFVKFSIAWTDTYGTAGTCCTWSQQVMPQVSVLTRTVFVHILLSDGMKLIAEISIHVMLSIYIFQFLLISLVYLSIIFSTLRHTHTAFSSNVKTYLAIKVILILILVLILGIPINSCDIVYTWGKAKAMFDEFFVSISHHDVII